MLVENKTKIKTNFQHPLMIALSETIFLLAAYFFAGNGSLLFFGVLLYFVTGYVFPFREKPVKAFLHFFLSLLIFFVVIFVYEVKPFNAGGIKNPPNFYGLLIYFLVFIISFITGRIIRVRIGNKDVRELIFYSLLCLLIVRTSAFFGKPFASSFSGLAYFYFGFRLFRKSKFNKLTIFLALTVPYLAVFVSFSDLKAATLAGFVFILFSVTMAYFLSRAIKKDRWSHFKKWGFVSIFLLMIVTNFIFTMNWLEYLYAKTDHLPETGFSETFYDDDQNQVISSDTFEGKVVVLDLWSTSCGLCFKKFPEFERFYEKNKNRNDLLIYAVNLPYRDQSVENVREVIADMDYSFPVLIATNDFQVYKKLYNISGVPSVIILDKEGKMIYNSRLNNNPLIVVNNLQRMVDKIE